MPRFIQAEGPVTKVNVGRLTNSIFVFTLLFLFKNIQMPTFGDVIGEGSSDKFGLTQLPDIMSFLLAFLILTMIWILAFHIFHMVTRIDRVYLYLHLALLMMLIMIPITSHYTVIFSGKSLFPIMFHSIMLVIGLLLFIEWFYISRSPVLFRDGTNGWQMRCITIKMLLLPVTAVAGILLASCDLPSTQYIYFFTMVALALTSAYTWMNLKTTGKGVA